MALRSISSSSPISHLLHHILPPPLTTTTASVRLSRFLSRALPVSALAISFTTQLSIPTLLADIWESILRAVPKKKTSYRKKRQRLLAGKALKDTNNLNECSACGRVKKQHLLCPHCVADIRQMWKEAAAPDTTSVDEKTAKKKS